MIAVIEATRLTKSYGSHRGIVEVDLSVEAGEVFGFLGPNGAGKTTTIRTMLDLIRPTSGVMRVFGIESSVDPVAIHRRVGYIPGEFALYDRLTGAQTIEYFANLRGGVDARLPGGAHRPPRPRPVAAVQGVLQGQQAEGRHRRRAAAPARSCSSSTSPPRASTRSSSSPSSSWCCEAMAAGRTVFLSSHILSEVEKTCGRVAIIRDGRLVRTDTVEALRDLAHHQVELRFTDSGADRGLREPAGRERRRDRGPRPATAGHGRHHARRPGGRRIRPARLRESRAKPRGDIPGPVRPAGRRGEARCPLAPGRRPRPQRPARRSRSVTVSTAWAASTARRSATRRLAFIVVAGLLGGMALVMGVAVSSIFPTPAARLEVDKLVGQHAHEHGQPVREARASWARSAAT